MSVLNNIINAPIPFVSSQGGTGVVSPTAHGIMIAEGSSPMNPIVLGAGQVLIGTTSGDPMASSLTAGSGVTITSASGSITISSTGGGGFTYSVLGSSVTSQTMAANTGYVPTNNSTIVTFTLPTSIAAGAQLAVSGFGTAGWTITQSAGQTIYFGQSQTTVGTGGSLSSTYATDSVTLVCVDANTTFLVVSSVGNLTLI